MVAGVQPFGALLRRMGASGLSRGDERPACAQVFEMLSGGTLWDRIERLSGEGKLTEFEIARMAAEILKMLAQCHALGVIYRDVKPGAKLRRPRPPATEPPQVLAPHSLRPAWRHDTPWVDSQAHVAPHCGNRGGVVAWHVVWHSQ